METTIEQTITCHYYRCEDHIVWCEMGANFMSNKDKSDCSNHACKCRKDVKVLKVC